MDKKELIDEIIEQNRKRLQTYSIKELKQIINELENNEISY